MVRHENIVVSDLDNLRFTNDNLGLGSENVVFDVLGCNTRCSAKEVGRPGNLVWVGPAKICTQWEDFLFQIERIWQILEGISEFPKIGIYK